VTEFSVLARMAARPAEAVNGARTDPVFVLCAGRSGSTLLRFLLDAHPDLACPPETNVPALCGQLATVWSLIEGAPLSANRGDEPPDIPDAAIAGVRETMDRMIGSYLARRGKKRYCDKSLGTARFAYLMNRVWPEAKFICLFRHPMDVIASGIEACPWGLSGYGFDPYISETPGNAVFALARFWADNAVAILAAEERYADRCVRVRYEDLVADPESTAARIFEFLGVPQRPGISQTCFAEERERFGPADYKIWHTSRISTDSVGRGWTIPAGLIGPQVQAAIGDLCGRLGYVPVDDGWGTADRPADLRASAATPDGSGPPALAPVPGAAPEPRSTLEPRSIREPALEPVTTGEPGFGTQIEQRLMAGLSRLGERFARRWAPCATESFMVVATGPGGGGPDARWRVDLSAGTVTALGTDTPAPAGDDEVGADGLPDGAVGEVGVAGAEDGAAGGADGEADGEDGSWDIIGAVDTWEQVIGGRTNMSVALRRNQLRYCDAGGSGPVAADARIGMLADLLGLTAWNHARGGTPAPAAARPTAGVDVGA
jgi:hypothetical protein